jgi:carbon-monoxide dehydrogenase medium subunit
VTTLPQATAPSATTTGGEAVSVVRPATLDEALRLIGDAGADVLGGGVAHTLRRHARRANTATSLVSVASLPELNRIALREGEFTIGAGLTLSALGAEPRLARVWPAVTEAAASVATARVRRLVTLGGNIAAGEDSHDPPVALAAAGALLTLHSSTGVRTLPVTRAAQRRPDEVIVDVRVPAVRGGLGSAFEKFLVRGVWEYACVNVAAAIALDETRAATTLTLAVGSVEGGPVTVDLADLKGRRPDSSLIEEAARRAGATTSPHSDVRGSAAYKSHMIAEFSRRALARALSRAQHSPHQEGADR